jgi:peroxiredoxin
LQSLGDRLFSLNPAKRHAGGAVTFEVGQSTPAFELSDPDMNLVSLADTDAEACESYGVLRHANHGVTSRQHADETLNRIKEMDEACR